MTPITQFIINSLFAIICVAGIGAGFSAYTASAEDSKSFGAKGPVVITSLTMMADNKANTALFEGSVIASSDNARFFSDKMLVFYDQAGKVTKIEADGRVKLLSGERVITSEAAVYFANEEKLIFTGQPKAIEGGSIVSGTKMIYMMREDRYKVENSKVFIEEKKGK